jgi:hypothetical protein
MTEQQRTRIDADNETRRWSQRTPVNELLSHAWKRRGTTWADASLITRPRARIGAVAGRGHSHSLASNAPWEHS